jgi:hypothetical protein
MQGTRDGLDTAICKERDALAAAMNGHGPVFPHADCAIRGGAAVFTRNGKQAWRCNAAYAGLHFSLVPKTQE